MGGPLVTLSEFAPVPTAKPGEQSRYGGRGRARLSNFVGAHKTPDTSNWSKPPRPPADTPNRSDWVWRCSHSARNGAADAGVYLLGSVSLIQASDVEFLRRDQISGPSDR